MEKDVIRDIIENIGISTKDKGKFIKLYMDNYKPSEISKDNFSEIKELDLKNKIAFVDGGNAEILKAANFSLQLIRVYYTIYQNNKRIENKRYEFYLLIKSSESNNKIVYKTKTFGDKILDELEFDSFDKTLMQGTSRADVSFVGNVIRRFSELNIAKELVKKSAKDDIVVLDGSLEFKYTNEEKILDDIYSLCDNKEVIFCGFSKTCELLTDKGSSFIGLISEMQPNYNWSYYPVAEFKDSKYDILFSKLSKRSNYIFRIDINHINKINDVLSLLMKNSNDPIFLGYPYGLVEADKFARVSNKELELLKTKFMIKAGKDWKSINNLLKTKDSHGILDRIS